MGGTNSPVVSHQGLWLYALPLLCKPSLSQQQQQSSYSSSSSSSWAQACLPTGLGAAVPLSASSLCILALALLSLSIALLLMKWASPCGPAWGSPCSLRRAAHPRLPGPRGLPLLGSLLDMRGLAHRRLASLAASHCALPLMGLSLGHTRTVVASMPSTAKEILTSSSFADRPLKESARQLLFDKAIGFAPHGEYWRKLRRIAASHLFSPRRIMHHELHRRAEVDEMLDGIAQEACRCQGGSVLVRPFLQQASLNNIMYTVFGRRYEFGSPCDEARELQAMVREGFELLGAFNLGDHLPAFEALDVHCIKARCEQLVPRVNAFVSKIIQEHRQCGKGKDEVGSDFVHVLLGMQEEEKLGDTEIIAILWEMIFRGTDSVAILFEWILAELVLHPDVQEKTAQEIDNAVGKHQLVCDSDIARLPYLQAVVYETLRLHPPGPLLSWARLCTQDVQISGYHVPEGTTAMVNMWAITHDPSIWADPLKFQPGRFLPQGSSSPNIDIRGTDLRLAPFGAGRRVCPGRALGLATVNLWLARSIQRFRWIADERKGVDLTENLKLSCEMKVPLSVCPVARVHAHQ